MSFKHNPVHKKDMMLWLLSFEQLRLNRRGRKSLLRQVTPERCGTSVLGGPRTQLDKAMAASVGKRPLRRDGLELSVCL